MIGAFSWLVFIYFPLTFCTPLCEDLSVQELQKFNATKLFGINSDTNGINSPYTMMRILRWMLSERWALLISEVKSYYI